LSAQKSKFNSNKSQKSFLIIDPSISGISGDMLVAALVNLLGTNAINLLTILSQELMKIDNEFQLSYDLKKRGVIEGTILSINCGDNPQLRHPKNLQNSINQVLTSLNCSIEGKCFAERTIDVLLDAEAQVHGEKVTEIHLHETGSVDTIFDICATAILLDKIRNPNLEIISLPISVGGGLVKTEHGILPVPSPAATQIAKDYGFILKGGPINFELMTPTGAAILAGLHTKFQEHLPILNITGIGIGGGQKNFPDHSNILRVIQGQSPSKWRTEELIVLETNVDDVTGEVLGNLLEKLMSLGAMDVSILPSVMKKNRPGQLIKVICNESTMDQMMTTMIRETGTLGIRITKCQRIAVNRISKSFQVTIEEKPVEITAKIAWMDNEIISIKTEFSELKKISEEIDIPIKSLQKRLDGAIYEIVGRKALNDD